MHCLVLCVPNSSAMAVAVSRASLLKHECGYPCCEHRTEVSCAVAAGVSYELAAAFNCLVFPDSRACSCTKFGDLSDAAAWCCCAAC